MGENIEHTVAKPYGHIPMCRTSESYNMYVRYAVSHRFYTVGIVLPTAVIFMYNKIFSLT